MTDQEVLEALKDIYPTHSAQGTLILLDLISEFERRIKTDEHTGQEVVEQKINRLGGNYGSY